MSGAAAAAVPTRTRTRRALATVHLVPLALAIVAEAAWVTVVSALVQEFSLRLPTLGIAQMATFVVGGVVAARLLAGRLGGRWPLAALGLCVAGGLIGWLLAPEARAALASEGLLAALAANPGGWIAAIAVLRGFAHARIPLSEDTLAHLLGVGILGVAIAAIVGGMIAEPWRGRFLDDALVAAIVFPISASLALALVRLSEVGVDGGFDWRRNPSWVALLIVLVAATAVIAVPVAVAVAPLIALAVGASIGPILVVGLIAGFDLRTVRLLGIFTFLGIIVGGIVVLFGREPDPAPAAGSGALNPPLGPEPTTDVIAWVVFAVILAVAAIIILARLWMRRQPILDDEVREERSIDRGEAAPPRRKRTRRRRGQPADAVAAYVRLVDDLADRPTFRREAAETPSEHAGRLRRTGRSALALDLLAADYELARFAERELSPVEDRRAVGRWQALRRRLVERPDMPVADPTSTEIIRAFGRQSRDGSDPSAQ